VTIGVAIAGILLGLYEPIRKLIENDTDADYIGNALALTLEAASATAEVRIATRAGRHIDAAKVLAFRYEDLARASRVAGYAAHAAILDQIAASLRGDATEAM